LIAPGSLPWGVVQTLRHIGLARANMATVSKRFFGGSPSAFHELATCDWGGVADFCLSRGAAIGQKQAIANDLAKQQREHNRAFQRSDWETRQYAFPASRSLSHTRL
jgi:hypothetical protein